GTFPLRFPPRLYISIPHHYHLLPFLHPRVSHSYHFHSPFSFLFPSSPHFSLHISPLHEFALRSNHNSDRRSKTNRSCLHQRFPCLSFRMILRLPGTTCH
ncbi:hypothetical protein PFISCL1PPCAC_27995, partial [Pristionchus fissidentatus]